MERKHIWQAERSLTKVDYHCQVWNGLTRLSIDTLLVDKGHNDARTLDLRSCYALSTVLANISSYAVGLWVWSMDTCAVRKKCDDYTHSASGHHSSCSMSAVLARIRARKSFSVIHGTSNADNATQ